MMNGYTLMYIKRQTFSQLRRNWYHIASCSALDVNIIMSFEGARYMQYFVS